MTVLCTKVMTESRVTVSNTLQLKALLRAHEEHLDDGLQVGEAAQVGEGQRPGVRALGVDAQLQGRPAPR